MTIKNILAMVKEAKPDAEWLKNASRLTEIAKEARKPSDQKFEKLERLDLRHLGGSEEEPIAILVHALSDRKEIKTVKMKEPMNVFEVEIVQSNKPEVKAGARHSIWENTTVLKNEMRDYAERYGDNGSIADKTFLIASYGTVPSKKNKKIEIYIFRVIPIESPV
jgi:hypothetical protein